MGWLTLGFVVLIVNSAYLAARADPTLFYFTNLALHMGLGFVLAVAAALRWAGSWRAWPRLLQAAGLFLAAGAVSGVTLAVVGATRPHAWILWTHIASASLGAALVLVWMAAAAARHPAERNRKEASAIVVVALAAVVLSAVTLARDKRHYAERFRIVNPAEPPVTMDGEGAGPQSPFFP